MDTVTVSNSTDAQNVTLDSELFELFESTTTTSQVGSLNCSNDTLLNNFTIYSVGIMSKEEAELANFIIYQLLIPIVCITGIIGNLMSLVVINKRKDQRTFTKYIKVLTGTDALLLFCGMARFFCSMMRTQLPASSSQIKAYCDQIVSHGLGYLSMNLSAILIAIMSVNRLVAVVYPFKLKRFLFERYPKSTIIVVFIVKIIFCLPSVIWTEVVAHLDSQTNSTNYYVNYRSWAKDLPFRQYFSVALIIFDMILPIVTVTVANIVILITLKRGKPITLATVKMNTGRHVEERRITVILVTISIFYVLTSIPRLIMFIMSVGVPDFLTLRRKEDYFFTTAQDVSVLIVCLNAANDSLIYSLASKRLRQELKKHYFGRCSSITTETE